MKTVLITGTGKGIGKSLKEIFLSNGWNVIGTIYTERNTENEPNFCVYPLDLSSPQSISDLTSKIQSSNIKIDALINNAGCLLDEENTEVDPEKLRKTLDINLIGTITLTERLLSQINESGQIVNISSTAGSLSLTDKPEMSHLPYHYPSYKISKAALNMYTKTLSVRLSHEGKKIRVNSIHPGWVKTDIGGTNAEISPEEAAKDIFDFVTSNTKTGQFIYKGQDISW